MSDLIDRWNVRIDRVDGEPIVSMWKQNHGPYVSYDKHAKALEARDKTIAELCEALEKLSKPYSADGARLIHSDQQIMAIARAAISQAIRNGGK